MLQQPVVAAAISAGHRIDPVECLFIFIHFRVGRRDDPADVLNAFHPLGADGSLAVGIVPELGFQLTHLIQENLLRDARTDDDKLIPADPVEIRLCEGGFNPFGTLDQDAVSEFVTVVVVDVFEPVDVQIDNPYRLLRMSQSPGIDDVFISVVKIGQFVVIA